MNTTTYYAIVSHDADLSHPTLVMGWASAPLNQDGTTPPFHAGDGYKAVPLTMSDEEWAARVQAPQTPTQLVDGKLMPYKRPGPSLKEHAQDALQDLYHHAAFMVAMGQTFGPQTREYVRILQAIIAGDDTTRTSLPPEPADATL